MEMLKKAIIDTKSYARNYGQKLSDEQLFLRLISPKVYCFQDIVGHGEKNIENLEWQKKVQLAIDLANNHLSKFSGVEMVGITGSSAAESAKKDEDIDLLIITSKDELWWWRLYIRCYVWWFKIPHRKFGKNENRDDFCFNMWLDGDNLEIPKDKRNIKNATDLVMMKIIFDKNGCYQKFLRKNAWVKKCVATGYGERRKINREIDEKLNSKKKEKNNFIKKIINGILFLGQYLYIWSKLRRKIKNISMGQAFFHKDA